MAHVKDWWGGKREGAGRKPMGITRKVSITMSEDAWAWLEREGDRSHGHITVSKRIRELVEGTMNSGQVDIYEAIKKAQREERP